MCGVTTGMILCPLSTVSHRAMGLRCTLCLIPRSHPSLPSHPLSAYFLFGEASCKANSALSCINQHRRRDFHGNFSLLRRRLDRSATCGTRALAMAGSGWALMTSPCQRNPSVATLAAVSYSYCILVQMKNRKSSTSYTCSRKANVLADLNTRIEM